MLRFAVAGMPHPRTLLHKPWGPRVSAPPMAKLGNVISCWARLIHGGLNCCRQGLERRLGAWVRVRGIGWVYGRAVKARPS